MWTVDNQVMQGWRRHIKTGSAARQQKRISGLAHDNVISCAAGEILFREEASQGPALKRREAATQSA